jgi:hypothetical protein
MKADAVTCHPLLLLTMMMTATRGRLNDVLIEIFDKRCTEASGRDTSYIREREEENESAYPCNACVSVCAMDVCVCVPAKSYQLMMTFPSLLFNQSESLITSSSFSRECMN